MISLLKLNETGVRARDVRAPRQNPHETVSKNVGSRGDRTFYAIVKSGSLVFGALLVSVALFLIFTSIPAFTATTAEASLLKTNFWHYVGPLLFGTVWSSTLALLMAVPTGVGIALFLTHYASRRFAKMFASLIDLLAAVPSVVFGLWGIMVLAPSVQPLYEWITETFAWFAPFSGPPSATGRTIFTAAMVLAVMVLPIISALTREVFMRHPKLIEEGALALGATKWEMIRLTVLPFSLPGILSASMLGLGRALGETMAVTMVLSATGAVSWQLFTAQNPSTIAANIALTFPEAYKTNINVLIATGLILFVITLIVSTIARSVVRRVADV